MKKNKFFIVLLVCFFVILISGCGKQDNAADETWGRADAKEIDINSKVAGRVTQLLVKEGDSVEEGQVIAYIDQRDLLTQKAQAEANIKALEAQQIQASVVTVLQTGTTTSDLNTAQESRNKAQADLQLAQADLSRYEALVAADAVPVQVYDNYKTRCEVAAAAANQAEFNVSKATSALLQSDADKANEQALAKKLEQAQAALAQIEVALDETEIKAPFTGVITAKYVEEGSMVSLGMPLVAIQDPTDNWVDIKVPETDLSKYAVNDDVWLQARDGKTKVCGTITDISKKAEFATQRATSERGDATDIVSFNVKIQVDSEILRPGMRFRLLGGAA